MGQEPYETINEKYGYKNNWSESQRAQFRPQENTLFHEKSARSFQTTYGAQHGPKPDARRHYSPMTITYQNDIGTATTNKTIQNQEIYRENFEFGREYPQKKTIAQLSFQKMQKDKTSRSAGLSEEDTRTHNIIAPSRHLKNPRQKKTEHNITMQAPFVPDRKYNLITPNRIAKY